MRDGERGNEGEQDGGVERVNAEGLERTFGCVCFFLIACCKLTASTCQRHFVLQYAYLFVSPPAYLQISIWKLYAYNIYRHKLYIYIYIIYYICKFRVCIKCI